MLVDVSPRERLANLLKELRGERSQRSFAKLLGVSNQAVQNWEKQRAWPDDENLQRLAELKGWTLEQLKTHLNGETTADESVSSAEVSKDSELPLYVQQLLAEVRALPFQAAAKVAQVALETMAAKGS
jgi:transcriptional regulator with XRE-family HTH domain